MPKGRPPSCRCGICSRCLSNARKRKDWDKMSREQRRARVKRRDKLKMKVNQRRQSIRHDKRYPERARARDLVQRALRAGKIKRLPCKVCGVRHGQRLPDGSTAKVEAHHEDYSRPYDIEWVCTEHHREPYIKEPNP